MTVSTLFNEYIWLINTIFRAGKISLREINNLWQATEMSGGLPLSRSTFNRHKNAIEDIFDIYIECDARDGYRYYIGNEEVLRENSVQNWMLSSISVNNVLRESVSLQNRILLENIPSSEVFLQLVLEAMKGASRLAIDYRRYSAAEAKHHVVEPYCLKLYRQRWYLLARMEDGSFRIFSLDRIEQADITSDTFVIDPDFDAEEYFYDCYGVYYDKEMKAEHIVLRAFGTERYYLRDLPLHHSQREIVASDNYSDFEYTLRPSADFIGRVLFQGSRLQVLSPRWLADEVANELRAALELYG